MLQTRLKYNQLHVVCVINSQAYTPSKDVMYISKSDACWLKLALPFSIIAGIVLQTMLQFSVALSVQPAYLK